MKLNLADPTLFGNDAGEEENPEILAAYFVGQDDFVPFLDSSRRLQFARGRKGMGKSALLAKLAHDIRSENPEALVIQVTGADLTALGEFASPDPAILLNQWQQVLCARITQEIGARIGFAVTDHEMLMVEMAELAGFKNRNVLRSLVDRLAGKVAKLEVTRPAAPTRYEAMLREYAQSADDSLVWVLIDDIDATFFDTPPLKLKIGTFFSACRKLAREVRNLNIRASVRTDVWSILRDNEDLDKAEQYMVDIRWTKREMETIILKRILAHIQRVHPNSKEAREWTVENNASQILDTVFLNRIKWGGFYVPPVHALNILSAKRPRWLAQLCRLAGSQAAKHGYEKISASAITPVLKRFGELRLNDLYKEHIHQFSDLKILVESFAGGKRTYSTDQLLQRIQDRYMGTVAAKGIPRLEGRIVKGPMDLAHFLYRTGFISGQDNDEEKSPEFVEYSERPDLLRTDANRDDGLKWAIYPSYRNVLRID